MYLWLLLRKRGDWASVGEAVDLEWLVGGGARGGPPVCRLLRRDLAVDLDEVRWFVGLMLEFLLPQGADLGLTFLLLRFFGLPLAVRASLFLLMLPLLAFFLDLA